MSGATVIVIQPSCTNPNSTGKDELYLPPKIANQIKADFYLSIHINASGNVMAEGFESHIHPVSQGKNTDRIRNILHDQIMAYLGKYGVMDRGKKYSNFAVLRNTNMPAVLIECGFIDNAKDAELLKDAKFIDGLANEIAYGLKITLGVS